jgi:DNA-binding transcriptional MerR regulator
MTPKLYKVAEVCEIAQLQPYVLKSWEKEFPGIGLQKADDSGRLYRQADLDQVLRIKQLVFGEGLTIGGARRRLEESAPASTAAAAVEVAEAMEALGADARKRIGHVRDGLRSLLEMLSRNGHEQDYRLTPIAAPSPAKARASVQRGKTEARSKKVVARGKSTSRPKTKRSRART